MALLTGKSIIITGGASGIGEAAVLLAAERGARLTVADMDQAGGEDVCERARAMGAEAQFIRTDIASSDAVEAMVAAAINTYGRLDGAFNNAGIPNANLPLVDIPQTTFERMQAINLTGTFLCLKYEIREMVKTGGGAIVNTSSTAATNTLPGMGDYGPAKAGILAMTRAAALDHGKQGVRVNAVLPGPTLTKMFIEGVARSPGLLEQLSANQPLGRLCQSREVAAVALWLLSDDASVVTGVSMPADGGLSIL